MGAAQYNLDYKFASDLKEVPADPISMEAYVKFCQDALGTIKITDGKKLRLAVKLLGDIGAYAKILRKLEVSAQALEKSLKLIEENKMDVGVWAVHTLRFGDTLRYKKDFLAAETAFRSVLEMSKRNPELQELEDFALQHLGKMKFDENDLKAAQDFLQQALELRSKKGVKELIDSTEQALRVIQMKISARKKY